MPPCLRRIPYGLSWNWNWTSTLRHWRLTGWDTAQPRITLKYILLFRNYFISPNLLIVYMIMFFIWNFRKLSRVRKIRICSTSSWIKVWNKYTKWTLVTAKGGERGANSFYVLFPDPFLQLHYPCFTQCVLCLSIKCFLWMCFPLLIFCHVFISDYFRTVQNGLYLHVLHVPGITT